MAPLLIPQQSEEQTQLFSDPVLAGTAPDVAQQAPLLCLSSDVYLVMVTQKGKSRPQRSPGSSVPEAWIPISERFTEILARSKEGREEGKMVTRRRKEDQE